MFLTNNVYLCGMAKENKKVYTVNIKPSIMNKIIENAEKENRSVSAYVQMLFEKSIFKTI